MISGYRIFSLIVGVYTSTCLAQSSILPTSQLSDSKTISGYNIILFGEQHVGKQRKAIHQEWFEICNKQSIDTMFIEQPYSVYLNALIDMGMDYMTMKPFTDDSAKVLVPVDIEDEFDEAIFAIRAVLSSNGLEGSIYDIENDAIYTLYRRTRTFDTEVVLEHIDKLRTKVLPEISSYKHEFGKLLDMMEKTYTIFTPEELSAAYFTKERDSLMAVEIKEYVSENDVVKWAGLFGAYHVSHIDDRLFEKSMRVEENMYHQLLKNGLFIEQQPLRIIYKSFMAMEHPDSRINLSFCTRYDGYYKLLNKKNVISDLRKDVWFWITKK